MKKTLILTLACMLFCGQVSVSADITTRADREKGIKPVISVLHTDKEIIAGAGIKDNTSANELDQRKVVYDSNNITIPSGVTVSEMYELLKSTTYCSWENAQAFVDAEKLKPSVNSIFLLGLTKQESLHGRSGLAKNDNNISSIRLKSGKYKHFDSIKDCIIETENLLSKSYLSNGGVYNNGLSIEDVAVNYCEGAWADDVNTVTLEVLNKANKLRSKE